MIEKNLHKVINRLSGEILTLRDHQHHYERIKSVVREHIADLRSGATILENWHDPNIGIDFTGTIREIRRSARELEECLEDEV